MKPPSFSSLQDGKEKICYPTIAKNTRMMDVLAEMQQQEVLAVLRKRERTERRILIGVMFIITSVIIAIFVASMAAFVAIKHYEHYGSPSAFRVRPGAKLSKELHSHYSQNIDSLRKPLNASPLVALSPRSNLTDKQLKEAPKETTSPLKDEKNKPSMTTTPLTTTPKDKVEKDFTKSLSTAGASQAPSPPSLKLRVLSKSLKEFEDSKNGNSTKVDLETESPVTILPDVESSNEKRADEIVEDDETKESTEVYISASTSSPPTMKSVRVSSTSQPSSSSLFGLVSRRGYSLESPFVSSTLGLPSRRSASTFASGTSTTSSTGSSFIPPGNVWSFESPLQMISSARNWLQQRGFLNP